jgi:hypothetical protein
MEIVVNGLTKEDIDKAIRESLIAISKSKYKKDILSVSAGNYGGKTWSVSFSFERNIKMKPLVFKNKIKNRLILDMSWISDIDTFNVTEIKNKNIQMGNRSYKVSELFQVTGEDCNNIKILKSNSYLVNIGNNLKHKTYMY